MCSRHTDFPEFHPSLPCLYRDGRPRPVRTGLSMLRANVGGGRQLPSQTDTGPLRSEDQSEDWPRPQPRGGGRCLNHPPFFSRDNEENKHPDQFPARSEVLKPYFEKENVILNNPEISDLPRFFVCLLFFVHSWVWSTLRVGSELGHELHKIHTDTFALPWNRLQPWLAAKSRPSGGGKGDSGNLTLFPSF